MMAVNKKGSAMRIAVVVNYRFPELSQTFVLDQVLHLVRLGHEVVVFCEARGSDTLLDAADAASLASVRIVSWFTLPNWLAAVLPWRIKLPLSAHLRQRQFGSIGADVVLAHFGWAGARVCALLESMESRPPLITIYHGRDVGAAWHSNRMADYNDLFRAGALHLTVNAAFAELLIQAGAPPGKVRTHHLGIPVEEYGFRTAQRYDVLRFLSVCRLVEKKGIDIAIRALARLAADHPEIEWRYDIGGDGPEAEALRDLVRETGLSDRIYFLGPLKHAETLARIRAADVLLQPSVTAEDGDQEGIPVILMEAMAIGVIVCSTRHSGIPELVEDGISGLLSDEHDIEGLAANLHRLATMSQPKWTAMARAGRQKVETAFNEETQNAALAALCAGLAAKHPKGMARA